MENWLNYVKTKYVVTDIADESIVYETIVEGDIRNVIMPSDIIRSRKDYRLSIYLETDDEQINSKLSNKLLASLVWNSSALKLTGDDGINLGDLVTTDIFQTTINNILNQLSSIDLSQYYKKDESHTHFVEDVVHIGDTPPDDTNMLWYDTSDTSYAPDALSLFNLRGTVNNKSELPATGVKDGDVYKVVNSNEILYVVFNKGQWDTIGYEGPVVIASNEEPANKNVIWYDLDDDTQNAVEMAKQFDLVNYKTNTPIAQDAFSFIAEYHTFDTDISNNYNHLKNIFFNFGISTPFNVENTNYNYKYLARFRYVTDFKFKNLPAKLDYEHNSHYSLTPVVSNATAEIKFLDSSVKEIPIKIKQWYNRLLDNSYVAPNKLVLDSNDFVDGPLENGTIIKGTLSWDGPEVVMGYDTDNREITYKHRISIPLMSISKVEELIASGNKIDIYTENPDGYGVEVINNKLEIFIPHVGSSTYGDYMSGLYNMTSTHSMVGPFSNLAIDVTNTNRQDISHMEVVYNTGARDLFCPNYSWFKIDKINYLDLYNLNKTGRKITVFFSAYTGAPTWTSPTHWAIYLHILKLTDAQTLKDTTIYSDSNGNGYRTLIKSETINGIKIWRYRAIFDIPNNISFIMPQDETIEDRVSMYVGIAKKSIGWGNSVFQDSQYEIMDASTQREYIHLYKSLYNNTTIPLPEGVE